MSRTNTEEIEGYRLNGGLVRVRILQKGGTITYNVEEEKPDPDESKKINGLINRFRQANKDRNAGKLGSFYESSEYYGALTEREKYFLDRYYLGYGILQPLLGDPRIEDISCDGANIPVFVFIKEYGYIRTNISFNTEDSLNFFIRKLVQDGGKQISVSVPVVETTIKDGSRVSASLGRYITTRGPSFSIRKFREVPMSPVDLMKLGTASSLTLAYLWTLIDYGANIMVVGGTATGKTTFLNAILSFVSPDKKIVTIEDTRELNLKHENWISTVTRTFGSEGGDENQQMVEINMFDLLESALRHRPNYIVVGEVRGAETFTVFQAMLAGRFGMGTFHADDIETFIHRLEARPISIPRTLITSLNTAVILDTYYNEGRMQRRVKELSEIVDVDPGTGELVINMLTSAGRQETASSTFDSYAFRVIAAREGVSYSEMVREMFLRRDVLERLSERNITDFGEVLRYISLVGSDEKRALEMLGLH